MKKRNALVLTGLARDFNLSAESIRKNLIEPFSIAPHDIYIDIWNDKGYWYPGDALIKKSFLEAEKLTTAAIAHYYPGSHINIENYDEMEPAFQIRLKSLPEKFRKDLNHSNYFVRGINLVSMFYKMNKGINQIKHQDYNKVIRTRPDIYLPRKLRLFSTARLRILKQRNHLGGGLGDNLHVGTLKEIAILGEIYNNLEQIFELNDQILCPHLFIERWLAFNSIPYREFSMRGWSTLHTPAGQYKTINSKGEWGSLKDSNYDLSKDRFNGLI